MDSPNPPLLSATDALRDRCNRVIINTYGKRSLAFARGQGATLWDVDGREYLDFFAGIAVCNLGHAHPKVTEAIQAQAGKLLHVSNLYYIESQIALAETLCGLCFADRWFFCNSGAEANEAAIKLSRRYWEQQGSPKPEIVTAEASFHGRTLAAITATGQPKYHHGFAPLPPGFHYVPYGNFDALAAAITPGTGAVLLEPLQGEGGVRSASAEYWTKVRQLCNDRSILLILDEVQTGMGRTGPLFAHQDLGITPDIMTLAKGLANGVPIGALGCTESAATGFEPGSHAATFGGNPLSTSAALATLEVLTEPGFLERAADMGKHLFQGLEALAKDHSSIVEVRGKGLMAGVEFSQPVAPLVAKMAEAGIVCGPAGPNVLRFLPPLIIGTEDVDRVLSILAACIKELDW